MKNIFYILLLTQVFFAQNGFEKGMICIKGKYEQAIDAMEVC
jgi:hypothetical protein